LIVILLTQLCVKFHRLSIKYMQSSHLMMTNLMKDKLLNYLSRTYLFYFCSYQPAQFSMFIVQWQRLSEMNFEILLKKLYTLNVRSSFFYLCNSIEYIRIMEKFSLLLIASHMINAEQLLAHSNTVA